MVELCRAFECRGFYKPVRCFPSLSERKNDNTLTYELRPFAPPTNLWEAKDGIKRHAAEWMRIYYSHAADAAPPTPPFPLIFQSITSHRYFLLSSSLASLERIELSPGKPYAIRNGQFDSYSHTFFRSSRCPLPFLLRPPRPIGDVSQCRTQNGLHSYHSELPAKIRKSLRSSSNNLGLGLSSRGLRPIQHWVYLPNCARVCVDRFTVHSRLLIDNYTVDEHSFLPIYPFAFAFRSSDARNMPFFALCGRPWKYSTYLFFPVTFSLRG